MRIDALSSNRGSLSPATEARPAARNEDVPKEPVQSQPAAQAQQASGYKPEFQMSVNVSDPTSWGKAAVML